MYKIVVVYTYLQGVHQDIVRRLEFLFWQPINGLCQRRRPSRPFKVSRLSFPAEYTTRAEGSSNVEVKQENLFFLRGARDETTGLRLDSNIYT
jgi:hypothetical protein